MPGRYDTGGSYQPLSPNFANFQVLASPPANPGAGRSYFDLSLGVGVFANSIWNYASGGAGAITSVFGRTGVVIAASNDYTFAQIASTPTTVAGYGISDAVSLTGIQTLINKTLTSPTLTAPVLGTPSSGNLSSCTALPISTGVSGLGTGIATFLTTPSSANLITAVTDETGTGSLVFATSPALVTPTLGVASATTVNKVTITAPTTSATLTLAQGSSLVTSGANSITLTSTGATNVTLPTSGTLLAANQTVTLSGDISGSGATAITTAIGANKVTLGMQATIATGKVIGNPTAATATPTATTVPVLIASGTASAQATLDINFATLNTLFTTIELELISFVPATDNVDIVCRVSVDGTTFDSAAANYRWVVNQGNDGAGTPAGGQQGSNSDTGITMNGNVSHIGNAASGGYNSTIKLYNPGVATFKPQIMFQATYLNAVATGVLFTASGSGIRAAAQVTKGLRILFSSGNISSGIWRLYGRA